MNTRQKVYALGILLSLIAIVVGYELLNKEHKNYSDVEQLPSFAMIQQVCSELTEVERGELGNKVYAVGGWPVERMDS